MKTKILYSLLILLIYSVNVIADERLTLTGNNIDVDTFLLYGTSELTANNGSPINYFKAEVDYALEFWTLLSEPVFSCHAKWRYKPSGVWVGKLALNNPEKYFISANEAKQVESQLSLYDLEIMVSLGNIANTSKYKTQGLDDFHDIYIRCEPGALSKSRKGSSLNTPYSPKWNKTIAIPSSLLNEMSQSSALNNKGWPFGILNKQGGSPLANHPHLTWLSENES